MTLFSERDTLFYEEALELERNTDMGKVDVTAELGSVAAMTLFHGANSPPVYEENLDVDKIDATAEELGSVAAMMSTVRIIWQLKQARARGEDRWYPLIDWVAYYTTIMRMHASTWLWDAIPPRPLLTPLEMRVRVHWTVLQCGPVVCLARWYDHWGEMYMWDAYPSAWRAIDANKWMFIQGYTCLLHADGEDDPWRTPLPPWAMPTHSSFLSTCAMTDVNDEDGLRFGDDNDMFVFRFRWPPTSYILGAPLVDVALSTCDAVAPPHSSLSSLCAMNNADNPLPLPPAKRVPRQFRVPDEFRGRPVVGVAVDFEVTGSFRLQRDVVFAGAFAVAATRADGTLVMIEEMSACFVQPLDRREGETWRDLWTRCGFDELCWRDVWSREENQRVLDELHAMRECHVDDLGEAVRETVAGLEAALCEAGCAFAWKTDCAPFDLAVVNDYCLAAGQRDMGYYRAGDYGAEFHEYWPMFLGAVAVLRGKPVHALVEADYEPLNARIKQRAAAAFPATHRPLDDTRNILARFHYTHEVLAAEMFQRISTAVDGRFPLA